MFFKIDWSHLRIQRLVSGHRWTFSLNRKVELLILYEKFTSKDLIAKQDRDSINHLGRFLIKQKKYLNYRQIIDEIGRLLPTWYVLVCELFDLLKFGMLIHRIAVFLHFKDQSLLNEVLAIK